MINDVLAALMGAILVVFGLLLVIVVAGHASRELTRTNGHLPARFDDSWWALRHAAYFALTVIGLGVVLLIIPTLSDGAEEAEASPTPSAEQSASPTLDTSPSPSPSPTPEPPPGSPLGS